MFMDRLKGFFLLKPLPKNDVKKIYFILVTSCVLRLSFATFFPISNDEAYYWDWAQEMRLSYFDHPPGVSYVTAAGSVAVDFFSQLLGSEGSSSPLAARLLVPVLFMACSLFLLHAYVFLVTETMHPSGQRAQDMSRQNLTKGPDGLAETMGPSSEAAAGNFAGAGVLIPLTLVPGVSLLGVFALPDIGLCTALAALLWISLRLSVRTSALGWSHGFVYGLLLGIAGLFKYHALVMGGGLALGLFVRRLDQARRVPMPGALAFWLWDKNFWLTAIFVGALVCLPVWIWNYEQKGASILFQLDHGFGGPTWNLLTAARLLLAQVVLLGPAGFWLLTKAVKHQIRPRGPQPLQNLQKTPAMGVSNTLARLALWGALPLMVTVVGASFFKEMMPHWLLPAWVLLVPLVGLSTPQPPVRILGLWMLVTLVPCVVLSVRPLRQRLVTSFSGDPGPLSELTVWEPLADAALLALAPSRAQAEGLLSLPPSSAREGLEKGCNGGVILAGRRWYAVAQLRFHLKGHPKVLSLDPNHNSYYRDRDQNTWPAGCPVAVVALQPSLGWAKLETLVTVEQVIPLRVFLHEKQPWILVRGRLTGTLPAAHAAGGL